MSAIIFLNLPGESIRTPEEHCGIAALHAYAVSNGFHAQILDAYAFNYSIDKTKNILSCLIEENKGKKNIFLGISPYVTSHNNFVSIGEFIHSQFPFVKIIAGGHYASLNKEYLIDKYPWLFGVVVGEGEKTLLDILCQKRNIPGFFSREQAFLPRKRIEDLSTLPMQTRYLTPLQLNGHPFSLVTSRGCYGNCKFCSISSFYELNSPEIKQTFRSVKSVCDEISYLRETFGVTSFKIVDDNFFRHRGDDFLRNLSKKLSGEGLSFRLSARPNDITPERAQLLAEMGTKVVAIGVESADEEVLRWINKGTTLQDSLNAMQYLENENITCLANFIMFMPILSLDGLEKNYNFVASSSANVIFHRIDSHLWLRATDPIVEDLKKMQLCDGCGFPYLKYKYQHPVIEKIYQEFSSYCALNNKCFYHHVDKLMALGIDGHEIDFAEYKKIINDDLAELKRLIRLAREL